MQCGAGARGAGIGFYDRLAEGTPTILIKNYSSSSTRGEEK
jgi:hypothetical protein